MQYNGGFLLGIKAFAAAVLGGIGNIRGALLGGFLLGLLSNYGAILLGRSDWADVVAFVVLVLVLLVRTLGHSRSDRDGARHDGRRQRQCRAQKANAA